jgi:vacuole morphology and inheritance protein 14
MDPAVQRLLNDKLYDKRKQGALEYINRSSTKEMRADHIEG